MRRDGTDKKWQAVKKKLIARDGNICRLIRSLNIREAAMLRRNAGSLLQTLDPAHIYPVSTHPHLVYEVDDLVQLNRYSHTCLDNFKDPVTGKSISKEQVMLWWQRIAGKQQWNSLMKKVQGGYEDER